VDAPASFPPRDFDFDFDIEDDELDLWLGDTDLPEEMEDELDYSSDPAADA